MTSVPLWDLAIVGAGQSAKALLMSLAQARALDKLPAKALSVVIFTDSTQLGSGFAWDENHVHSSHLSSLANAYPRGKFGAEEHQRFEALRNHLHGQNVHVEVVFKRASAIRQQVKHWQISDEAGAVSAAHHLVLAMGYSAFTMRELKAAAPCFATWPFMPMVENVAEIIQHNRASAKISIVGGYLTAVDAVCGIAESLGKFSLNNGTMTYVTDHQYKLDWYTKDGFLPKVWGKEPGAFKGKHLNWGKVRVMLDALPPAGNIPLQELIGLLMLELASEGITNFDDSQCAISQFITWLRSGHQGHPHKVLQKDLESVLGNDNVPIQYEHAKPLMWQQILFGTLPMFSELSARLSQQDKLQFKQHIRAWYYLSAMPMALVNAGRIEALLRSGFLEICEHDSYAGTTKPDTSSGDVSAVINATGFDTNIRNSPLPLVQQMMTDGIIVPQSLDDAQQHFSGIEVNPDNCRLINDRQDDGCRAYAMGPLLAGTFVDAQSIGHIHRDAARIVNDLCNG